MQQLAPALGNKDVQPVDQYPIYELGGVLQRLKDAAAEMSADETTSDTLSHFTALWLSQYHLNKLMNGVPFRLYYCRGAVETLLGHVRGLLRQAEEDRKAKKPREDNALLTGISSEDWRWFSVRTCIDIFEHQFSAELQKTATYAVPERGIFRTEGLVDGADLHIHSTVIQAVSKFAREEFQASGRCLAFGLYSASGFHSARAVEAVLREYHQAFLPNQKSDDLTMGQMASALGDMHKAKKKYEDMPSLNTVRHLKDFTDFDRNPLIHKTVVLQEIDAVTLFNAAASVIVEMAKELLAGQEDLPIDQAAKPALLGLFSGEQPSSDEASEEQPS